RRHTSRPASPPPLRDLTRLFYPAPPTRCQTLLPNLRFDHQFRIAVLVTPAFLAGAEQQKDDCDLHVGTLRGQLRWWWRTLHAGHVSLDGLQRLEKLVWGGLTGFGGTEGRGSAVALHLTRQTTGAAVLFNKNGEVTKHKIPHPRDRKTIMGLHYGAYGMDETNSKTREHKQRHYLPEKTRWRVQISARASDGIEAKAILAQALVALWLLCRFGGVGSKSRKGWGSLADITIPELPDLAACKKTAAEFRKVAQAKSGKVADAMVIEEMILAEHTLPNMDDPWRALDHAGTALQTFAKNLSPKEDRLVLGLPRLIGGRPGTALKGPKGERHASPAHFHVARADKGFVLRLAAFPAAHLPDRDKSREILGKLAESVKTVPAESKVAPAPPSAPQARPQSVLLPSVGSFLLFDGEKVRVSKQIPPNKVEIEDENGEFIGEVLSSSLQPLPR
ncbi:type III-B CRISPR module RAMP protein Cmr1, partial [Acidiphilium sp.]|uniref:type III-B CRISPR module RAMP protein Cmr1 n=1 Tax=Acidiphilium sp. TaxID=527 RepID=UPI0025871768